MFQNTYIRTTDFKLFGFKIFSREEISKETNQEGEILKVYVSPDYYKAEFEDNNNGY